MDLALVESGVRWTGGALIGLALAVIYHGIWRGAARPAGRQVGRFPQLLRSPLYYVLTSVVFFGVCYGLWRPLPVNLPLAGRAAALLAGSLLCFPGLGLVIWGRLALGSLYFVSTGLGASLFAGHRLVTNGPYACVRHPMYTGIAAALLGGLLVYQTWTWVVLLLLPAALWRRAGREEQALAAEFGEAWRAYCRAVPAFIPRVGRPG